MRKPRVIALLACLAGATGAMHVARGQEPSLPLDAITVEVPEGLHVIAGRGGNVAVRVTPDGVILVDAMYADDHAEIMRRVGELTTQPIRYVLGTHHHGDHTGGNVPMAEHARIILHENARMNLVTGDQAAPPTVVFTEHTSVFLGEVEVQMHYVGRGHTDGDAVIVFPDLATIHTGDLFVAGTPFIDYANGGSSADWIGTLDGILALDFDTVIPGHGPVMTKSDVQIFRDRFVTLRRRMTQLIQQGVTKPAAATRLHTDDLEWPLDRGGSFVRRSLPAFYDEMLAETRGTPETPTSTDPTGDAPTSPEDAAPSPRLDD